MNIIILILFTIFTYFIWNTIHEASHLIAAHLQFRIKTWTINLIPSLYKETIRWASCTFSPSRKPTNKEELIVDLAPRVPDLLAAIMFPLAFLFTPFTFLWFLWVIFWGAGLIDFLIGSIGTTSHSDLQRASRRLKINPIFIRLIGFNTIFLSIITFILLL